MEQWPDPRPSCTGIAPACSARGGSGRLIDETDCESGDEPVDESSDGHERGEPGADIHRDIFVGDNGEDDENSD